MLKKRYYCSCGELIFNKTKIAKFCDKCGNEQRTIRAKIFGTVARMRKEFKDYKIDNVVTITIKNKVIPMNKYIGRSVSRGNV